MATFYLVIKLCLTTFSFSEFLSRVHWELLSTLSLMLYLLCASFL